MNTIKKRKIIEFQTGGFLFHVVYSNFNNMSFLLQRTLPKELPPDNRCLAVKYITNIKTHLANLIHYFGLGIYNKYTASLCSQKIQDLQQLSANKYIIQWLLWICIYLGLKFSSDIRNVWLSFDINNYKLSYL